MLGELIDESNDLELLAPVNLNIVCFRYRPSGMSEEERDDFNRRAVAAIQRDGRAFVTPTSWNGKGAIRAAFDNWATGPEDVEILWDAISDIGKTIKLEG